MYIAKDCKAIVMRPEEKLVVDGRRVFRLARTW